MLVNMPFPLQQADSDFKMPPGSSRHTSVAGEYREERNYPFLMIYTIFAFKMFLSFFDKMIKRTHVNEPWTSAELLAFCQVCNFTWTYQFFNGVHNLYLPSLSYGMSVFSVKPECKPNRGPIFTIYSHNIWAKSYSFLSLWSTLYCIITSFKSSQFVELLKPLCSVEEAVNNQHYGFVAMYLIDYQNERKMR